MILAGHFPDQYEAALKRGQCCGTAISSAELECIGATTQQAGAYLLDLWGPAVGRRRGLRPLPAARFKSRHRLLAHGRSTRRPGHRVRMQEGARRVSETPLPGPNLRTRAVPARSARRLTSSHKRLRRLTASGRLWSLRSLGAAQRRLDRRSDAHRACSRAITPAPPTRADRHVGARYGSPRPGPARAKQIAEYLVMARVLSHTVF